MPTLHFKLYAFLSCWVGLFGGIFACGWLFLDSIDEGVTNLIAAAVFVLSIGSLLLGVRLIMHDEIREHVVVQFQVCATCGFLLSIFWLWLGGEWSFTLLAFSGYSVFVITKSHADQ
ncbi:hypothetical protein QTP81_02010 [Alteromonas sp. ASW11-36]|uniref:Uncharacterized protein n=1 Tax=Alteromonas arenosi TaxID=3055817 RepID=A0ABT7SV11_9ALTE|nr:hypothetical protein [Alteromonas sp. ASW11-36]MDM7859379.1 hypothetical protein [Alteromonas sp. ASW11-36]